MSFAAERSRVKAPSGWFSIGLVLFTLVISFCCIYFDQARAAAFVTVPVMALLVWCDQARITYINTRKIKLCIWALCCAYLIAGNAALMQVISVEAGNPIISSGFLYQVSLMLARSPG